MSTDRRIRLTPPGARTALRPPEGDPTAVSRWKVSERVGGWDVVGYDAERAPWEIVYECLHLHVDRGTALACGRATMPEDAAGPSR